MKPDLDLFPFGEYEKTNIIWTPSDQARLAGPCVFLDDHDPDPSRRYKLFTCVGGEHEPGIYVAFSPDGIRWRESEHNPVLTFHSDTTQCAFWDPRIEKYVAFVRMKPKIPSGTGKPHRAVGRVESYDFEHWTLPEVCFLPPRFQFYSMGVTLYQGIYVGTPWILWEKSRDREKHDPVISPGLAVSRDGWTWRQLFVGEPFIPTGGIGSNDERMVHMASSLVVLDDSILLFYGESRDPHVKDALVDIGLASLRLDGFVAMVAGRKAGRMLTKPLTFEGDNLYINAECESGGTITVAVLDEGGRSLPGLSHEQCIPVCEDSVKLPVTWQGNTDLGQWHARPVRLEFIMEKAKLYSFWFSRA